MGSRLLQSGIPVETETAGDILATPFAQEMFMNGFNFEPFVNEVGRIKHLMKCLEMKHQDKKLKACSQYEQDIENTRRKYDFLLENEDAAFEKEKALLQELRQKVERGKLVSKEFRTHFVEQRGVDASHEGLVPGQCSNFILDQAPVYQVETLRTGSILRSTPDRSLSSAIAQPTGT